MARDQYRVKAAVWNEFPRIRISLDDVIALRLANASPELILDMKKWLREDRGYGVAFASRVARILGTIEARG